MCDEDAYARALARISVAQILYAQAENVESGSSGGSGPGGSSGKKGGRMRGAAAGMGGVAAQSAVVASLADLLGAYVQTIGERARARAEHGSRTRVGLNDVIAALERGNGTGVGGSGGTSSRVYTRELAKYARLEKVVFPRSIPPFPAPAPPKPKPGTEPTGDDEAPASGTDALPPGAEPWMPPLPASHTYISTPGLKATESRRPGRADLAAQRRQVGTSLARLQESASGGGSGVGDGDGNATNPFLRPPTVGDGSVSGGDDVSAETRVPIEPLPPPGSAPTARESNRPRPSAPEPDSKRLRIDRVLKDSGGVTGVAGGGGGGGANTGASGGGAGGAGGGGGSSGSGPGVGSKENGKAGLGSGTKPANGKNNTASSGSKGGNSGTKSKQSGSSGGDKKSKSGGSSSTPTSLKPLSATAAAAATATPLAASKK